MLNKLHYLKRDTEGSWIEQAKEMDLTCSERETSKALKSEKLVPQPKIYVRQQMSRITCAVSLHYQSQPFEGQILYCERP